MACFKGCEPLQDDQLQFDFVIVGAGSAGCVLAGNLSASGKHSVLLLEAGPDRNDFWITTPLGYGHSIVNETVNWMYASEPEAGLGGRTVAVPRGKIVGGSSAINAMVYVRGTKPIMTSGSATVTLTGPGTRFWPATSEWKITAFAMPGMEQEGHCKSTAGRVSHIRSATHFWTQVNNCKFRAMTTSMASASMGWGITTIRFVLLQSVCRLRGAGWNRPVRRPNFRLEANAQVVRLEISDHKVAGVTLSSEWPLAYSQRPARGGAVMWCHQYAATAYGVGHRAWRITSQGRY